MEQLFDQAAAWLNGKRDFNTGLDILKQSRFKPGVVAKLERDGEHGPSAMERLTYQMREYCRVFGHNIDVPDTDPELHVFDGKESPVDTPEHKQVGILSTARGLEDGSAVVEDPNALTVIREFSEAYKKREKAIRLMAEVGENNDDTSVVARKRYSDEIDECTSLMERLYPLYEKYQSGSSISEKDIEAATSEGKPQTQESESRPLSDPFEGKTREELIQLKKNATSRIIKARNKLLYQTETKQNTPNPMPDGAKRVKLETKIANEERLIESIDMAIAKFG